MPVITRPSYERAVIIHNPSGQGLAEACREELLSSRLGKSVLTLQSKAGGHLPNAEQLMAKLRPGDVIGGVFGDGTARDVIGALLLGEVVGEFGKVPFVSLAGGNARDIGRATQRRRHAPPSIILAQSVGVDAYAMGIKVRRSGDTQVHHAISYAGVGKTAQATDFINSPAYKLGIPGVRDVRVGVDTLANSSSFEVVDNESNVRRLGDLTFAKGPRMAKIGRFPVEYWEDRMRVTPVRPGVVAASFAAAGLLVGHAVGEYYNDPYNFTLLNQTSMHLDGDPPIELGAGDEIEVGLISQPYTLLTTMLEMD